MNKIIPTVAALAVTAQVSWAQALDTAVNSAITDGVTSSNGYLAAAIAIPVAFFVFKLGKRVLGRA
jgi:uncharacterized membrane protein YfbV (UPF0208 family)